MKISPVSGSGITTGSVSMDNTTQPTTMAQQIRALKMKTNVTPGYVPDELPQPATVDPAQTLSTGDVNNDQAQTATEENQPLSPQFAALAKQRRALQVKEREIAEREKALSERSGQTDSIEIARLKSDPLGVLLDSGVTYEQLTEAVLASQSGVTPEIRALKAELAELKSGIDKKLTDREAQTRTEALGYIKADVSELVAASDEFEAIKDEQAEDAVVQYIDEHHQKTGQLLDITKACRDINQWLINDALRKAKWKSVQSQLAPPPAAPMPPQQQRQMRTLTNRDTAAVPLSRTARALAAFNGTLKK